MILIKNNLKLMLRCKPLILILLCMIMVTGMLSAVFKDMMTDNLEVENFELGYSFSKGCVYEPVKPVLENIGKENGIELVALTDGSAQNAIQSGKVDVFAEFSDEGCTVYSSDDRKIEASVVEMIISSLLSGASGTQIKDYLKEYKMEVAPMVLMICFMPSMSEEDTCNIKSGDSSESVFIKCSGTIITL